MDARLQRRVQRYGWDKAVGDYEAGWKRQLEPAQSLLLECLAVQPGEGVVDVACGTGLVTERLAEATGAGGTVIGIDLSGEMVAEARRRGAEHGWPHVTFQRSDAESLPLEDGTQDVAVCALGLMYAPDPVAALREMARVLRSGGRAGAAVWGARSACGWAEIFPITDARVASEVCPMFFQLGNQDMLARSFETAGFEDVTMERLSTRLDYTSAEEALGAAFRGGPVAMAYGRFDEATREAVHAEYLASIEEYRQGEGYSIPGEFVIATGCRAPTSG